MVQLLLTLIFYAFLAGILVLVFLMWRTGVRERQKLTQTLVDATRASTEAAKESAEAVRLLAEKKEHPS
jgi:hypothetical protein